jgi:hypothetical protein
LQAATRLVSGSELPGSNSATSMLIAILGLLMLSSSLGRTY